MMTTNALKKEIPPPFYPGSFEPSEPQRINGLSRPVMSAPLQLSVAAFVLGEGNQITKASDSFLSLVGYSMDELLRGALSWRDLSASQLADGSLVPEADRDSALVNLPPFTKDVKCRDGKRISAEISAVILNFSPFQWLVTLRPVSGTVCPEVKVQPIRKVAQGFEEFIGGCAPMKRIMEQIEQVAPTDATTLILGETGTGKELVARAIHNLSSRKDQPFITLNCAALPPGILESELFGHERGAFTGALSLRQGRFELAHNGTLFLDEIGDLPVELQPKLLRALQERTIERLGGSKSIPINVRIIAATNRDLPTMIAEKQFRSELFYRLNVFPITTPPLRARGEDIALFVHHFTKLFAARMNKPLLHIPDLTMAAMAAWHWPGNVRELENFIERSVILSRADVLSAPFEELRSTEGNISGNETLEETKRQHILKALRDSNGVVKTAADRLGMCRTTLNALMNRLNIQRRDFQ